jgi:hypothetical protein
MWPNRKSDVKAVDNVMRRAIAEQVKPTTWTRATQPSRSALGPAKALAHGMGRSTIFQTGRRSAGNEGLLLRRVTSDSVSGGEALAFERWLARCERILSSLSRLNLEERVIALNERDAAIIVEAMSLFAIVFGFDIADTLVRAAVINALTTSRENAEIRTPVLR